MEPLKLSLTDQDSSSRGENSSEELSFEEALHKLEEVVAALENGGVPLEKSLEMLKRGLDLAARCDSVLSDAELTLQKLVLTEDGELTSEDVEGEFA